MIPSGTISEILTHKGNVVLTVSPDASVFEAIQKMADKNVGALLVVEGERLGHRQKLVLGEEWMLGRLACDDPIDQRVQPEAVFFQPAEELAVELPVAA